VSLLVSSDSLLISGGVDLTCSASVDHDVVDLGNLVYSFTWYNNEEQVFICSERTIVSTLTLSPLSVDDSHTTCSVAVAERLGRWD